MDAVAREVIKQLQPAEPPIVYPIEFYSDHIQLTDGQFSQEDFVEWAKKGESQTNGPTRVATMKRHNPAIWQALELYYKAWKDGQDAPVNGTPLSQWTCPGLGRALKKHLESIHIRSVEDLATANDGICQKIGMGAIEIRKYAKAFVAAKTGDAVIAVQLVERDKKIEALQHQVQHLMDTLEAQTPPKKKASA